VADSINTGDEHYDQSVKLTLKAMQCAMKNHADNRPRPASGINRFFIKNA